MFPQRSGYYAGLPCERSRVRTSPPFPLTGLGAHRQTDGTTEGRKDGRNTSKIVYSSVYSIHLADIINELLKFADDTKVYGKVTDWFDRESFQKDLNKLVKKSKLMYVGREKLNF